MKLDLGCGPNKKEGFIGVDIVQFNDKVDVVCNLGKERWPFDDDSVEEVNCSHMVEHLEPQERIHFCNELYRVLKKGGKALIVAPHWSSQRAYGDMTHKWPPVADFWFYYLDKDWRATNAPHCDIKFNEKGYTCDFHATWGYTFHPMMAVKNSDFQQFAMQFYKEAVQDIVATLTKK